MPEDTESDGDSDDERWLAEPSGALRDVKMAAKRGWWSLFL
jgi:hypothetical protein